ncbi:hypothetical protein E9993_21945 [Labilibacter sediminis]|nr:hypothetical protein E9993_21945 [Labilibacter sediminis]
MNRLLIIYCQFLIVLSSCQNNAEKIQGNWIEKDNFENPTILEIEDFSFKITSNNRKHEKLYHIQNDTFYVNGIDKIYKSIIKLEDNELEIYDIDSVTPTHIFERYIYENIVDYFNSKKRTSIELPRIELSIKGTGYNYQNSLFADYINGELVLHFNGDLHELNDTSYLSLTKNNWKTKCQLFIDKDIKVNELNTIKTELRKAHLNSIGYATIDSNGIIKNIGTLLPPIDSISDIPLPPPPPIMAWSGQNNIIIQIKAESLSINEDSVKKESFIETLKNRIKSNNNAILRVFFNKQLNYETYINHLNEIHTAYFELRNEYSKATYNIDEYLELEYEEIRKVRKQFPMKIHEINEEEIEKYAL